MVKRFELPRPLYLRALERPARLLDAEAVSSDDLGNALLQTGVVDVYRPILRRWFPYVDRKLALLPSDDVGKVDCAGSSAENARTLCQWMGLLYVSKRLGTFQLLLDEDGQRIDGTSLVLSSALTQLADMIGPNRATAIYQRLEKEANRVLSGDRSRG